MWKKSFPPLLKQLWNKLQWECSILKMIENWKKKKTIRQWWKNKSDIFGPFPSLDRMSQFIYCWQNWKHMVFWANLSLSQSYLCNIFQRKKKTFSINTRKNMKKLKTVLNTTSWFCKWFNENRMTLNPSKCDYPSLYLLPQSLQ